MSSESAMTSEIVNLNATNELVSKTELSERGDGLAKIPETILAQSAQGLYDTHGISVICQMFDR